jgi:hypothetical protein
MTTTFNLTKLLISFKNLLLLQAHHYGAVRTSNINVIEQIKKAKDAKKASLAFRFLID